MNIRYTFIFLLFAAPLAAQYSVGGKPLSFSLTLPAPKPFLLPELNLDAERQQDSQHPEWQRFAAPVQTLVSLGAQGTWTDVPGGRVWRCAFHTPNGKGMVLLFDRLSLPAGARFFVFTPKGDQVLGAFTEKSATTAGKCTVGPIQGQDAILELFEPTSVRGQSEMLLNRVDIAYDYDVAGLLDFGSSLPCNVNINCPDGAAWQTEKKGVARILMVFSNGSGWCTGSLIANTGSTSDPYFLTAHHCQLIGLVPDFDLWRFDFDYESANCNNPGSEPIPRSILGCERVAYRSETDFMLLKLEPIPSNYNLYFNGWTRSATAPANTTYIHHPQGDIKKITKDNQAPLIHAPTINWGGIFGVSPSNTHWNAVPEIGTFQPGSSGCPLFDPNKRIIGQLHGGSWNAQNNCIVLTSFFGRFDLSWNQGSTAESRLREWLDPTNTNLNTKDGYFLPQPVAYPISGKVQTHGGQAMAGVKIQLTGAIADSTTTDNAGNYQFNDVPSGLSYTITPSYSGSALNGVTTYDMVLFSKHLLGTQDLDSPWKIIAGDANKSNTFTTFDMVDIRKVILGINPKFPNVPSWRFFPATATFSDPLKPFDAPLPPEVININNLQQPFNGADFIGVKIGDANASAVSGQ